VIIVVAVTMVGKVKTTFNAFTTTRSQTQERPRVHL
jgi:hypothetical protein